MTRFVDKVAIVTGATSGIGLQVARMLAQEGAKVAVVASSDIKKAASVCDLIKSEGGIARDYVTDVSVPGQTRDLAESVKADFGQIDLLVNAAGVFLPTPIFDAPRDHVDASVDINLKGTWNMIEAVAPHFKNQQSGKIVNFASVAGVSAVTTFAIYSATKAAIIMLTRALAAELAPFGINVNAIAPGNTATPMNEAVRTDPAFAEQLAALSQVTPSNVTFSAPEDIAKSVLFLLSEDARPLMGATLVADEGISATIM